MSFSLFKTKSVRDMEARLRFRRGKGQIQKFVRDSEQSSKRYWNLARQAYQLGDSEQFRLIGAHYLQLQQSVTRWRRFLLKLEAIELRRDEVVATKEFLQSIETLTSTINQGVSPQEIAKMQSDIARAIEASNSQEEMLDAAMDAAGTSLTSGVNAGVQFDHEQLMGRMSQAFQGYVDSPMIGSSDVKGERELDREIEAAMKALANSGDTTQGA